MSGITVYFTDTSTPGPSGPITAWHWDFGDGNTSTAENPQHTYAGPGSYDVALTVTGSGGDGTSTIHHTVVLLASTLAASFTSAISGLLVSFTDTSTPGPSGPITGWLWDFGDGHTSTSQNPTHTYAAGGTYTVSLTITGTSPDGTANTTNTVSPPSTTQKLAFRPPTLTSPTTILVGTSDIILDPTKDYILQMPATPLKPVSPGDGGIWVRGGRNIVLIGGEIDFTGVVNTDPTNEKEGRVATFFNVTGTIHVEGLWAYGNGLIEGIQMYSPAATLQVENCRFDHLHVEANLYHSDLIQWGQGTALKVDHFTGSSELQGISNFGVPGSMDLRNTNLVGVPGSPDTGPVLAWLQASPVSLSEFYVQPRPGQTLISTLRPSGGGINPDGSVQLPGVTGLVKPGPPAGGDFCPLGTPGIGYVSPGYL